MLYIGIDVGTSSVKLVLINEAGKIINSVERRYHNLTPKPGWIEQNPVIWYENVILGIKDLLKGNDANLVRAIGVTGQMHTTVILDDKGNVIRPAILWNDTRTSYLVKDLKLKVQNDEDTSYLANIISTGSPAVNLLWIKENEPSNFNKIKTVLILKDYIVYRLTGVLSTDYCDSSTSALLDLKQKKWSEKMKDIIGIGDILPEIHSSADIVGTLRKDIADILGLNSNVKVIAGTGDNAAAAVATGCIEFGSPLISIGTSGVIIVPTSNVIYNSRGKNILFSVLNNDMINLFMGVVQAAASCNHWWMEDVLETDNYLLEHSKIKANDLGQNEVIFFPHLTGDKTVYADPLVRGAFIGLGIDTTRAKITQAILEGVAFALREVIEVMKLLDIKIERARVTGGGAKSDIWLKIISNVLNITLDKLGSDAGAAYGASILASIGCGEYESVHSALTNVVTIEKTIYPCKDLIRKYNDKFSIYKNIYPFLKNVLTK